MNVSVAHIVAEINTIYQKSGGTAGDEISRYLEESLSDYTLAERGDWLNQIAQHFEDELGESQPSPKTSSEHLAEFATLLLGYKVSSDTIDAGELNDNLCRSISSVFISINKLMSAINETCNPGQPLEETVRFIIHEGLVRQEAEGTLEEYIDKIRQSYIYSHESAKQAFSDVIDRILQELDPGKIVHESTGGLKIGPLKRANAFEAFEKIYQSLKDWHNSGRGVEEYLRNFERQYSELIHAKKEVSF